VTKSIERYASHLYRGMRDSVLKRAQELETSVSSALRTAQAASQLPEDERERRRIALAGEIDHADRLHATLSELHDEVVKLRG
jgi:hypothetical protein